MTYETENSRIIVSSEAVASIHEDGIVILHTRKGCLFTANRTGASIWRCIEQQLEFEAIVARISREYQICQTVAQEQAMHFLAKLEQQGLIERVAKS